MAISATTRDKESLGTSVADNTITQLPKQQIAFGISFSNVGTRVASPLCDPQVTRFLERVEVSGCCAEKACQDSKRAAQLNTSPTTEETQGPEIGYHDNIPRQSLV